MFVEQFWFVCFFDKVYLFVGQDLFVCLLLDKVKVGKFRFSIFTFYPPTHIFDKENRNFKTLIIMNGP